MSAAHRVIEAAKSTRIPTQMRTASRVRRFLLNFLLAASSVVVVCLVAEFLMRAFWPQIRAPQIFESGRGGISITLRPNVHGYYRYPEYTHRIDTNSKGMRENREIPYRKPVGTFRILLLGDSFTMGQGVECSDAYPTRLEQALHSDHPNIEVINAGTPGWSTTEECVYFTEEGAKFDPDLVVVAFTDNDVSSNLDLGLFAFEGNHLVRRERVRDPVSDARRWTRLIPGYGFLVQNSHLVNFIRVTLVRKIWEANPSVVQDNMMRQNAWKLTLAILHRLVQGVRDRHMEIALLYIPERPLERPAQRSDSDELFRRSEFTRLRNDEVLERFCKKDNVPFLNLLPALKRNGERECYYQQDTHWRPHGHQVAATELNAFLRAQNLIPASERSRTAVHPLLGSK